MLTNKAAAVLLLTMANMAHADWSYKQEVDPMTDAVLRTATVTSSASLSLSPPYHGDNHAYLTVRQHPKQGLGVVLTLDKGQFICDRSRGCDLLVRFDNGKPVTLTGSRPTSMDRALVFINDPQAFVARAKTAKRILIQPNLYNNPPPIIAFEASPPLEWSIPPSKPRASPPPKPRAANAEKNALCGPETNLASEGECGRLFAECSIKSREYVQPATSRYLTTCRRKGVAAADNEAEEIAARTHPFHPPPSN